MKIDGLASLQFMMLLEICIGWFLRKKNIITQEGKRTLTDLIIDLILPCNIIHAFYVEFTAETLTACFQVLIVSVILQILCTLISTYGYQKVEKDKRTVLKYATVCSNAGFLGNPVAEGLYGSMGLLMASIYLIPQRIIMWSAGVSFFTECPSKKEVFKKVIRHPCIVAVGIGMVLMLTQIKLPAVLIQTVNNIGGCNTALTMILIGTVMCEADMRTMITRLSLRFSVIRLVLIPLAVLLGCIAAGIHGTAAGICIILAAMPAGTTTAILASKYQCAEEFAGKCVVLTTVLSMAAIPAWCIVLSALTEAGIL